MASDAPDAKVPEDFEVVGPKLLPRVYGVDWGNIEYLTLTMAGMESAYQVTSEVNDSLMVGAVVDLGEKVVRVTAGMLEEWLVSLDEVLDAAVGNWIGADLAVVPLTDHAFMIEDPNYAAAVWLLPRLAASMLEGRPVAVATLTEEITLVADADDAEALTVILALADQHLADSHQMASVKPYAWDGADWKPVDLVARGVNPLLVSHVNHLFAQQVYAGQADPLREYFAVQDREIRVSPYDLFEDGSGAVTSVTAWTQGAVAALPRTDRLFLAPADGEGVMVPYAAAMEVLDDGVQDAGLAPARMIARAFPSGRRWRALQRLAL